MNYTYRRLIYIVFGLVPSSILFVGAIITLVLGTMGSMMLLVFGLVMVYAYICGLQVLFGKVQPHEKVRLVVGLIIGVIGCVSYGVWYGIINSNWWIILFFCSPAIVAGFLIYEVLLISKKEPV